MKKGTRFFIAMSWTVMLLLCLSLSTFAQNATISDRSTADDFNPGGYARWIKITVAGGVGADERLNNDFSGMQMLVDLNLDGDGNYQTPPVNNTSGLGNDSYYADGDAGDIVSARPGEEGLDDLIFYVKVKQGTSNLYQDGIGYDTNLRPRIQLTNSGSLRIISGSFGFSIQVETDLFPVRDGIKPIIRNASYHDDGSGNTNPLISIHPGNKTPFDGYIDRIDLFWSEPMNNSNTAVSSSIFNGLGESIFSMESVGEWNTWNGNPRRFTFYVLSSQPNTGVSMSLNYNKPLSASDQFKEISTSQNKYTADTQSRTVTDKAGPAIVSSKTIRSTRREPAAQALTSRRVEVTFSEPITLASVNTGTTDFEVITSATSPGTNNIQSIISPTLTGSSSSVFVFRLTTNFDDVNETGTIQFVADSVVKDILGNDNGRSLADSPPALEPAARGNVINILDGILPNITQVQTVDAVFADESASGGTNGWGYLDYVDVTFDHEMDILRTSASGFSIIGTGILTSGGTGEWITTTTFRIPLTATSPKIPNTGVVPTVGYTNPGDPNGLQDNLNSGLAEELLTSDTSTSSTNGLAVQILDKAGPAIIQSYTAGQKRIRITFSEKANTSGWSTSAIPASVTATARIENGVGPRFKWIVGSSYYDVGGAQIFFTGLSASRRDSVVYLNHTGTAWAKSDSGAINFMAQTKVYDAAGTPNGNTQWDNDSSLDDPNRVLLGSDVKVQRDNIPPILLRLETADFNFNGKLDHYKFVYDDLSPLYPESSFNGSSWTITGYDGLKQNIRVDMDVYNLFHSDYKSTAINTFGDTVEVYLEFTETTGTGPDPTPYNGDTGDIPDVVVGEGQGFSDWADNVMDALPAGLSIEVDEAGPAIMSAQSVNTFQIDAFMSEDLKDSQIGNSDFLLNMGWQTTVNWTNPTELNPGHVRLEVSNPQDNFWEPNQNGFVAFAGQNVVTDNIPGTDNGNLQTAQISVVDRAASQFLVNLAVPGDQFRGVPFQVEIIARDSHGNIDTNFQERINLSAVNISQNEIDLPDGPQLLENGAGYFTVTSFVATETLQIAVGVESDRYSRYYGISDPINVIEPTIDTPDTLIVEDWPNDQGGWISLVWPFSENHPGFGNDPEINYYQVYYELDYDVYQYENTIVASDTTGSGMDSMRIKINIPDNLEHSFWIRAVWAPSMPDISTAGVKTVASNDGVIEIDVKDFILIRSKGRDVIAQNTSTATTQSTATSQTVSGAVMGIGRAD